jgi:IPT/TIG domain
MSINPTAMAGNDTFSIDGRTVTNAAGQTATWVDGPTPTNIEASNGSEFHNLGTFDAQNSGTYDDFDGSFPSFVNEGTFIKSGSTDELEFLAQFNEASGGSVDVQDGSLLRSGNSTLEVALGINPPPGQQFTIIKSTAPAIGTFEGLPEGATVDVAGSDFTITCVGGTGNDVVLTEPGTASPSVTGVSPGFGPEAGGTSVMITGAGFTGATEVNFGTMPAADLVVVDDTTITVTSPPGTGTVDVTVMSPAGTSPISTADQFNYVQPSPPEVFDIRPTTGLESGGTFVAVTGTDFTGATSVNFGATQVTSFTVVSDTSITAISPAGTGMVNVTVVTPGGTSAASAADQFSFVAAAPSVVLLLRFGFHMQPTSLVLTFNLALDPIRTQDVNNYQIMSMGGTGRNGNMVGHVIRVGAAVYDAAALTVTLFPDEQLDLHNLYQLTVNGMTPGGLTSATGIPLDGAATGTPGTNYVAVISGKLLSRPALVTSAAARKMMTTHVWLIKGPRASAAHAFAAWRKMTAKLTAAQKSRGHQHHSHH